MTIHGPIRLASAHPVAELTARQLLHALDTSLPGLVTGFHLVGSAALDDFRPHASDLDFVAVLGARPDEAALSILQRLHRQFDDGRRLPLDGIYVVAEELGSNPSGTVGPCVVDGRFFRSGCHERHPAAWAVLREFGIPMRGPSAEGGPRIGRRALETWALARLVERDSVSAGDWPWTTRRPRRAMPSLDASHQVLSACRDHYAVATGSPTSKEQAGLYGLITFPDRWRPLIDEALQARRRPDVAPRTGDVEASRYQIQKFLGLVARDAHALSVP